MKKKIILGVASILILAGVGSWYYIIYKPNKEDIKRPETPVAVDQFKELESVYTHIKSENNYPFAGGAAIDVDGDKREEVFLSGGENQENAVLKLVDGKLVDVSKKIGLNLNEATFGATSFDIDGDGDEDLLIAGESDILLYRNEGGNFTRNELGLAFDKNSVPLNVTVGDINNDGIPDLYVSTFIDPSKFRVSTFNDESHRTKNLLLLGLGHDEYEDITRSAGVGGDQNTFNSTFVDLDNDGYTDLVVANNTGRAIIYQNNKDNTFTKAGYDSGLGYWMGLGVGDIDGDGYQDLFFSNVGNSLPPKALRGDLKGDQKLNLDWVALKNNGNFTFVDKTKELQLDGYGFAWSGVFEDLNLDGKLDLLVGQNYVKLKNLKLPGKAFLNLGSQKEGKFYVVDELGLNNPYYAQSPIIADLNGDGKPDVVWDNMGGPARVFLNESKNENGVKIWAPSGIEFAQSNVTITTKNGKTYTKQILNNVGFSSDQSRGIYFGLEDGDEVENITIKKGERVLFEGGNI